MKEIVDNNAERNVTRGIYISLRFIASFKSDISCRPDMSTHIKFEVAPESENHRSEVGGIVVKTKLQGDGKGVLSPKSFCNNGRIHRPKNGGKLSCMHIMSLITFRS